MAITLIASTSATPGANGGTTGAINTTGATLLVVSVAHYDPGGSPILSDNKANTWLPLTARAINVTGLRQFYAKNAIVGSGHTFTVGPQSSVYGFISVLAYSGADLTAPFVVESGATANAAGPLATGSVTPTADGSLVVSAWSGMLSASGPTVGTGLTLRHWANPAGGNNLGGAAADLVQTTAAAINPSWSWTGTENVTVAVAVFKPAAPAVAASLDVTQLVTEVASITPSTLDVTQLVIEILRPTVPDVLPSTLNPGWLAWVEWPQAPEVSLASGAVPPIVAYSDWDLQDPPAYYHGFKQARVERFGEASRTLSEPRTGDWQGSAFDVRLSDWDRLLRSRLASETERFWTVGNFIARMVTRQTRAALEEALTIFVGPLRRADPVPPLSMELLLEDVVGHTMLTDELLIPQRVIDASDWEPGLVVADSAKGHPVPIIYGRHNRDTGAYAPVYLGVEDDQHVWLVAGHAVLVDNIFLDGVTVLGTEGVDWTLPGYSGPATEDVAGKRYTLLRGRKGQPAALTDPILYAENAGPAGAYFETWLASYPFGGAGAAVRWDVNGTSETHGGARAIVGVDLREGELVRGQFGLSGPPGTAVERGYVLSDYDNLRLWLFNHTSFWPSGVTLELTFRVGPDMDAVGIDPLVLVHGVYGFDETNITTWQEIVIPIDDFAPDTGARADFIVIRKTGTDEISVSLDDLTLQGEPAEAEVTQADQAAAGTVRLSLNVRGWTTTGDDTGTVLTDLYDQYRHFLITYVANRDGYQTGGPLPNPSVDLFDRVVAVVHEGSFDVAQAQAVARYPPDGYPGQAILGATPGERLPVRQWISRWNLSADCRFGISRYGEMFIVMHDPTEADQAAAPVVDEVLDVLEGTFSIDMQWTAQATRVPFRAGYNWAIGEWTVFRDAENNDLSEAYGRPEGIRGFVREYWFIADSDQAKNVAEHEVQRIGDPPRVVQFECNLDRLVTKELGEYVTVRHFAGVGPDALRLCQIEELTIAPGTRRMRIRALDVTALVGETVPVVVGSGRLGIARLNFMRLGYAGPPVV